MHKAAPAPIAVSRYGMSAGFAGAAAGFLLRAGSFLPPVSRARLAAQAVAQASIRLMTFDGFSASSRGSMVCPAALRFTSFFRAASYW